MLHVFLLHVTCLTCYFLIWGAISVKETARLFFLFPGTTINGSKYLELQKNKLVLHMNVHRCHIFMQDGAPCHKSKIVINFLKSKKNRVLNWPGNSPDLNPIENLWVVLKKNASEQQPSSLLKHLENVIKTVWTRGIILNTVACSLKVSQDV